MGLAMKKQSSASLPLTAALAFAFAALLVPHTAQAQTVSKTAIAGAYTITLKVLPPESFNGPQAPMTRDGGAEANPVNGAEHPNHHLVVFIKENGEPAEHAKVFISYRELSPRKEDWVSVPVVRMHVTGKSPATTHYGNNVDLCLGSYDARVTVNERVLITIPFSLG